MIADFSSDWVRDVVQLNMEKEGDLFLNIPINNRQVTEVNSESDYAIILLG